ncbi:cytochrome P450 2D3-like [Megalops cyprinoides]|uniref:cytochrome P450 2D3-like n=1 Tax=Megalops cyprinoides TaxID=118141 RepID=UPI0018655F87|nr:cytochrome P450 2D3-like [Megalops cyprinoides]
MLGSLILLWISFCLLFFLFRTQRPKNFPPGPRPVPVFGNLLQLNLINPINDLQKLAGRYGKVFSLYIGSRPAVVISGAQAMKEALVTRSVEFAGRPQDLMVNHVTKSKGVILANYGSRWREHRRFALTTLRNFGLGKHSMEERILGEIRHISSCLEKNAGKSMVPHHLFSNATSDIICSVIFGSRYEHEDEVFQALITKMEELTKITNGPWAMLYDTLPLLRNLPLPFRKAFQNYYSIQEHVLGIVKQHKKTRIPGQPRDFTDCYLDELEKQGESGSSFDESQMVALLMDLLLAGTDTTSNTLLTAFLYLMTHPDVQKRCQREIDTVLGEKEQASYEDRHRMPYMQAMIHEVQRVADTVPLSVFHATTKDTQLMGFDIPKGTLIIPNLSSVLSEESQWKFPHDFNPENFLNQQGEFVKPEGFMPFSVGPRMCLGEGLARMELFLILVTLLRRFQFVWPEDGGVPDYTPVFGVTQTPKPYRMGIRLRATQRG